LVADINWTNDQRSKQRRLRADLLRFSVLVICISVIRILNGWRRHAPRRGLSDFDILGFLIGLIYLLMNPIQNRKPKPLIKPLRGRATRHQANL
jgi:hypothetical protein